jgi:hypothetical protein
MDEIPIDYRGSDEIQASERVPEFDDKEHIGPDFLDIPRPRW